MGGRRLKFVSAVLAAVFASALLVSCGSDAQSTQQAGSGTGATNDDVTSTAGRTGTSTTRDGDSTTGLGVAPGAEQIKQDLIGKTIIDPVLGEWEFESTSEFLSFNIESQSESDDRIEFVVGMKLKDIGDGKIYNGQATVIYTIVNGRWQLSEVSGTYRSGQPSV